MFRVVVILDLQLCDDTLLRPSSLSSAVTAGRSKFSCLHDQDHLRAVQVFDAGDRKVQAGLAHQQVMGFTIRLAFTSGVVGRM